MGRRESLSSLDYESTSLQVVLERNDSQRSEVFASGQPSEGGKSPFKARNSNASSAMTQQLLTQAVQVLGGEKAYNQANLDQYLMGIKKIKVAKKNMRKVLPTLDQQKLRNRLSRADESFYKQYSFINEHLSNERIKEEVVLQKNEQHTSEQLIQMAHMAQKKSEMELRKMSNGPDSEKDNLHTKVSNNLVLDFAIQSKALDSKKIFYKHKTPLRLDGKRNLIDFISRKFSTDDHRSQRSRKREAEAPIPKINLGLQADHDVDASPKNAAGSPRGKQLSFGYELSGGRSVPMPLKGSNFRDPTLGQNPVSRKFNYQSIYGEHIPKPSEEEKADDRNKQVLEDMTKTNRTFPKMNETDGFHKAGGGKHFHNITELFEEEGASSMEARKRMIGNKEGSGDLLKIKEGARSPMRTSKYKDNINDWHGPTKKHKPMQSSDFQIAQWENESDVSAHIAAQLFEKDMV